MLSAVRTSSMAFALSLFLLFPGLVEQFLRASAEHITDPVGDRLVVELLLQYAQAISSPLRSSCS